LTKILLVFLLLFFYCDPEYLFIVSHHNFESFNERLSEDQIICS